MILLLLYLSLVSGLGVVGDSPSKCCPLGQILDLHTKICVIMDTKDIVHQIRTVTIDLDQGTIQENTTKITYSSTPLTPTYLCNSYNRYLLSIGQTALVTVRQIEKEDRLELLQTDTEKLFTHFCLDVAINKKTGDLSSVAQVCENICSSASPCLNFCCPPGQLSDQTGDCIEGEQKTDTRQSSEKGTSISQSNEKETDTSLLSEKETETRLFSDQETDTRLSSEWETYIWSQHTRLYSPLHCHLNEQGRRWELDNEGKLEVDNVVRDISEFCINQVVNMTGYSILVCPKEVGSMEIWKMIKLIFVSLSLTSAFILLVLHCTIYDLRKQHFTKLKIPFYFCMFLSFLLLMVTVLASPTLLHSTTCTILGLSLQFFSLAIFSSLTSMSLDVWLTFSKLENPVQKCQEKERRKERLRLRLSLFSFSVPLIVTILTLTVQLMPAIGPLPYPGIGSESCFLGQYLPQFVYFHSIILCLLIINLILFSLLVFKFSCGVLRAGMVRGTLANIKVCIQFFFVMGITWLADILSFLVEWLVPRSWSHPALLVVNSINWGSGVIILMLFVSKSSNRDLLKNYLTPSTSQENIYEGLQATVSTHVANDNGNGNQDMMIQELQQIQREHKK